MPLDLVVPDLLLPPDAPAGLRGLRLPWLERWLARAALERVALRGMDAWLAAAFGLPHPGPVAAVALAGEDAPRPGAWLRADPVHLRIEQDAVALHDAAVLDVARDEADALVDALRRHFAADGLEFVAPVPHRWYVRVPEGELPATTPLADALGRNVFGLLPRGTGRINWGAAITEAQMVLSAHPANAAREAAGRPAINSVWFWGGGTAPPALQSTYALVYAADPFARGLGRLADVRTVAKPAGFAAIDAVRESQWVLVVEDRLTAALRSGDAQAWTRAAEALEADWFAGLGAALDRFEAVRLVLPGASDTLVATLAPAARWRWFRARKPLSHHA